MKKVLIINLFLVLTFFNIFTTVFAATITETALVQSIDNVNSCLKNTIDPNDPSYLEEIVDENNNVPAYQYYPKHIASRSIKTLKAHDGKIFMGLGDWNDNTGPVKMVYYDTTDGKIKSSGTILDEAVQLFNIIDGTIYTTGCDPREGWGYGSYYTYEKGSNSWKQHRIKSGWIHVFNIVKYQENLFMCGSTTVDSKATPIQISKDGGKTFENIKIVKDGTQLPYDGNLRFYNLVVYNNKLYGYCYYDPYDGIYEYDAQNNQFNYISFLPRPEVPEYGLNVSANYNYIYFKNAIFNNKFIFVSGTTLLTSTDMRNFTEIPSKTQDVVTDVAINGDTLYSLCYKHNENKTYTVRIYSTKDLTNFNLVYEFNTNTLPSSFEYYDNSLYIGTRYHTSASEEYVQESGSLYRIDLNKKTSLELNIDNTEIDISTGDYTYPVKYNLSENQSTFDTTLTFNNNMSEIQWKQEYYKLKKFNLIFATIANTKGISVDKSISYFNNVLKENLNDSAERFSNATDYAKSMFAKQQNIQDDLFTITSTQINDVDQQLQTTITLTINNDADFSTLNPTNNNDFINNNDKLPQTGNFFGFKNILQIVIIVSTLLIVFFVVKEKISKS